MEAGVSNYIVNLSASISSTDFPQLLNDSFTSYNETAISNITSPTINSSGGRRHVPLSYQIVISGFYLFGITGNIAALIIMSRNEARRYKKQSLMLRCLALNDLTALLGSFVLMNIRLYVPTADQKMMCGVRVLWRAFGLGSGCLAVVMAVDRWMALAHPFRYQKHITPATVRRSIFGLWLINFMLVMAPFFGFGYWYDPSRPKLQCVRYREGTTTTDRIYAYVIFAFGLWMCSCIVCCNAMVIKALCKMGDQLVARRHSRSSVRSSTFGSRREGHESTHEELSFARLMGILSVFFVICWMPQLVTILTAQFSLIQSGSFFYKICDLFIALNFALDPYLYVLFRRRRAAPGQQPCLPGICCSKARGGAYSGKTQIRRLISNGGSSWSGQESRFTGTTADLREEAEISGHLLMTNLNSGQNPEERTAV